jgi:hypothetical protein
LRHHAATAKNLGREPPGRTAHRWAGLLTAGQRESLKREGYLLVPSLLDEIVLAPMRARLDELIYQTLVAFRHVQLQSGSAWR